MVGQQVARLDDELKTTLLLRTTHRMEPPEAGRLLHARSLVILREAEEAFSDVLQSRVEPTGILRIAAPHDYGVSMIAPLAAVFTRRFPDCQVNLVLSDVRTGSDRTSDRPVDQSGLAGRSQPAGQTARRASVDPCGKPGPERALRSS